MERKNDHPARGIYHHDEEDLVPHLAQRPHKHKREESKEPICDGCGDRAGSAVHRATSDACHDAEGWGASEEPKRSELRTLSWFCAKNQRQRFLRSVSPLSSRADLPRTHNRLLPHCSQRHGSTNPSTTSQKQSNATSGNDVAKYNCCIGQDQSSPCMSTIWESCLRRSLGRLSRM